MAKPIFIMRAPRYWTIDHVKSIREVIYNHRPELTDEYHVLILHDMDLEEVSFECYNGDNDDNEELKEVTKLTRLSIERCLRNEENDKEKLNKDNE